MKIAVLCTNTEHPVVPHLRAWLRRKIDDGHEVQFCTDRSELSTGDVLFLVSCGQIVREQERQLFRSALVLHASDLPRDRGWSPHIWNIVEGGNTITVSLIEAQDPVDTGRVWFKQRFTLEGHELLPEINDRLFTVELALMDRALAELDTVVPQPQEGEPGKYRERRSPANSRLDPHLSIAEQFNLLRVVDNDRYPAFFDLHGKRYLLRIEKEEEARDVGRD